MNKTKILITIGLSALAMSAFASPVYIVGSGSATVQAGDDTGSNRIQPAGDKTAYENWTQVEGPKGVVTLPGDVNGDGLLDTVERAINSASSNVNIRVQTGDVNGDGATDRLLPTVNKRTATVTARGWDPEKKAIIEARIKAVTDKDENIVSAEVDTDKVEVQYRRPAKLFGFIPVAYYHAFTVDGKGNIAQGHPWWLIFATGDADVFGADVDHIFQHNQSDLRWIKAPTELELQTQRFSALTDILKTRHDASQQAVSDLK